jgi:glycosyltransferase involved in cell wall biosynthesis
MRALTLHNIREAQLERQWLEAFDVVFVHTAADTEILSKTGFNRIAVIPHGILQRPSTQPPEGRFTVGTFGFLFAQKAVVNLVDAVARASRVMPELRLKLFTCAQKTEESLLERARVEAFIAASDLGDRVETHFGFLTDDEIVAGLRTCNLLCFAYGESQESSSGAIRTAMAADRPLLCSKSAVLRDVAPYAHVLSDTSPTCIAEAILALAGHGGLLAMHDEKRREYIERHSFARAAQRYRAHFELLRDVA